MSALTMHKTGEVTERRASSLLAVAVPRCGRSLCDRRSRTDAAHGLECLLVRLAFAIR